jgi:hypothetical protein
MKIIVLLLPFLLLGCATLFVPQELSENYALLPGVECDAPEVVDGNINTISNSSRIIISLPEKKSISRIIIHNTNISDFVVYEYLGKEGAWKIIKSARGNTESKIVINTQVTTDKIRLFVSDVSGARFVQVTRDNRGLLQEVDAKQNKPEIQEIELYGFVNKVGTTGSKAPIF